MMVALMAANGICFLLSALLFDKGKFFKVIIYFFLAVNLILTITDQMGFFDYFILALNVISITSLIIYPALKKKLGN